MHEIMAMGSFPIIWSSLRAGWKSPEDMDRVTQDWIDYLPYVQQTNSLKYAACLDSYTSFEMLGVYSDFSSRRIVEETLAFQRGGVARALIEEHVSVRRDSASTT